MYQFKFSVNGKKRYVVANSFLPAFIKLCYSLKWSNKLAIQFIGKKKLMVF